MHTKEDWIRVICEQPADDNLRLIYADWLDEQEGESLYTRAIRLGLHCEIGRLSDRAVAQLLDGWNPSRYGITSYNWWRGFISRIELPSHRFMKHCKTLFSEQPIESAVLTDKKAVMTPRGPCWCESEHPTDLEHAIPKVLFNRVKPYSWLIDVNITWCAWFRTEVMANEVLSQILIDYGRQQASLPALTDGDKHFTY